METLNRLLMTLLGSCVPLRCNGKKECEINVGDVQNPDPCRGTFKYLDTNYTCLPASQSLGYQSL